MYLLLLSLLCDEFFWVHKGNYGQFLFLWYDGGKYIEKGGVYCWFPACRPIPAFHPIRSADRKDVGAGSPSG